MVGDRQFDQHFCALLRALDLQIERGAQPRHRLVERERAVGRAGGQDVVLHPTRGTAQRRREDEVMREVGQRTARARLGALQRLADAQVQLGPPHAGQPVIQRPPHQLVGEAIGQRPRGKLVDHPAAHGLVEAFEQLGVGNAGGAPDHVEAELPAGGGRQLQQLDGPVGQAGEPLADDLAHALGRTEVHRRAGQPHGPVDELDHPGLDEIAPQLADQEGVAAGEIADRLRQPRRPGVDLAARGVADELGDLLAREAGDPHPDDGVGAAQVGERLGQRLGDVGLGVAERDEHQQPRAARRPRQVAQEQECRRVSPVPVLEDEQHRAAVADARPAALPRWCAAGGARCPDRR